MSDVIISQRWLARGGTAADLATVNETPKARELILETDTGRLKRGDGATTYNDLPYINTGKIDFSGVADGKVPMWSADNSRFEIRSITADGVEYTAGSSSSLEADNVAEALDELSAKVDEKLGDAPVDGNTYGRKNGAWTTVSGGGSLSAQTEVLDSNAVVSGTTAESDVLGISLDAGTYIVTANWSVVAGAAQSPDLYIGDGTDYWAACTQTASSSEVRHGSLTGIVTVESTTTVKLRVKPQTTNSLTFYADSQRASVPGATRLVALKIAG